MGKWALGATTCSFLWTFKKKCAGLMFGHGDMHASPAPNVQTHMFQSLYDGLKKCSNQLNMVTIFPQIGKSAQGEEPYLNGRASVLLAEGRKFNPQHLQV